jgi:oligopeptide transport system substrate-binding protein
MNMMEGLFDLDENMNIVPLLTQSWKISPDGRTYEFKLKDGVKWTDGKPLTAEDFVYSWKRLLAPETAAPSVPAFEAVVGAREFLNGKLKDFSKVGIKALDSKTLQIQLKKRSTGWHSVLTAGPTFPMRKDIVEKFGIEWTKAENIQTLGPFKLAKVETQQRVVLKANAVYYGNSPTIQEAEAIILESGQTAISLFKAKKLDVVSYLSHLDVEAIHDSSLLMIRPSLVIQYLGFVLNKSPMTNVHFRRAIGLAIDKSGFKKILNPYLLPTDVFVPPFVLGRETTASNFNVEKAKAEFKKSGVGTDVKVKIMCGTMAAGTGHPVAEYIQQQLKINLGLHVEIDLMGLKPARESRVKHTSQIFIGGFIPDYADAYSYFAFFLDPQGFTLWQSGIFEKKIDQAQAAIELAQRRRLFSEAENILLDESPVIPLFHGVDFNGVANHVEAHFSPTGNLLLKDTRLKN